VEEIRHAECDGGDHNRDERASIDARAPVEAAQQEPDCSECQHERDRHRRPEGLAKDHDREDRRDDEVEPEDRRVDADRTGREAAQKIVEGDEDKKGRSGAPCGRRDDDQRAGHPAVQKDRRAKTPGLCHQEMMGLHTRCRCTLVDEIAEPVADQRREGVSGPAGHFVTVM